MEKSARPAATGPQWTGSAAAIMALLCAVDLGCLLVLALVGASPWPGLTWIAMIGLPVTFVLLAVALLLAIRRRQRL